MTTQIDLKEGASRQHLAFGMLCALYCFHKSASAIWIPYSELEQIIGISFTKDTRKDWLIKDLSAYFSNVYFDNSKEGKKLLIMSKIKKDALAKDKSKAIRFEPKLLNLLHYKPVSFAGNEEKKLQDKITELFPFIDATNNTSEAAIQISLSLLSQGIIKPEDVF